MEDTQAEVRGYDPDGMAGGPFFKPFRAISSLYHAAASPGEAGGRHRTDADPMEDTQAEVRGYDPDGMVWTTVPTTSGQPEPQERFKSAALASAVARREKAGRALMASHADAVPPTAAAIDTRQENLFPPAPRSAGAQGKKKRAWKPLPLPKPAPTDFVVVIKPQARLALTAVFPENSMGRAILAHLGSAAAPSVTIVPVCEQNLILVYTAFPHIADKIIGEFAVKSPAGAVPLVGHLRSDGHDSCYGVVTVSSTDTETTLRESLHWRDGEITHIRRLGTSNKVRLTFSGKVKPRYVHYDALLIPVQQYKKTVPACGLCGSIGHRPDACPGPKPDICGLCGSAAALVDGARAPHECAPRCSLCAGPHVTGDRTCKARYREPRPPPKAVPSGPRPKGKKKKKSKEKNRSTKDGTSSTNLTQLRPPQPGAGAGGPEYRGPTQDGPPPRVTTENGGPENSNSAKTPNGSRPAAKGDQGSWASRVHHGPQVSSQSRVAPSLSPSPASQPNTPPLNLSREQLEITKLREQVAFLTQKLASAELSQAGPNTSNKTQAAEEMESTPSEQGLQEPGSTSFEARLSALESQMVARLTAIENRFSAALQAALERIPGMIASQMPKFSSRTRKSPIIKRVSTPGTNIKIPRLHSLSEEEMYEGPITPVVQNAGNLDPACPLILRTGLPNISEQNGGQC
ncbi:hypothetical protein HPB50_019322 [Hyalomma asiaticum]|uniref:Uncharacterized protein n=1 Tax=Hyalomma asiaticum TaxID=266040 RepID=A0ACB7SAT1_HYAAI|nr:hypothetical protein HPB50_019322 [Hyalomma asiaticum]